MRSRLLLVTILLFLLYTFAVNFILDPEVAQFLSHKDKLPKNIPTWLTVMRIHTICASVALLSGFFNFRNVHRKKWHRSLGILYCVAVLGTVVTSGYMAPSATGGTSMAFNLLELAWLAITVTAVVFILRKKPRQHRNWMIRSYAICFTNFWVHLIAFLVHSLSNIEYRDAYSYSVYGSLLLIVIGSEYWIRRGGSAMMIALGLHLLSALMLSGYLVFPRFPRMLLHRIGHYALLVALVSGIWLSVITRPPFFWTVSALGLLILFGAVLGQISVALQKGQSLQRLKWVPAVLYLLLLSLMFYK